MKLRNKKTGEVIDLAKRGLLKSDNDNHIIVYPEGTLKYYAYNSLAELNEEWEDYKPSGPLIENKKIRKAVRAWAEANGEEDNIVFTRSCEYSDYMFYTNGGGDICFEQGINLATGSYTIAELCGEEEE